MQNFDFKNAKVLRDADYASRYVIVDSNGYFLMKKISHKALHTTPRYWTSLDKAQQALNKFLLQTM